MLATLHISFEAELCLQKSASKGNTDFWSKSTRILHKRFVSPSQQNESPVKGEI